MLPVLLLLLLLPYSFWIITTFGLSRHVKHVQRFCSMCIYAFSNFFCSQELIYFVFTWMNRLIGLNIYFYPFFSNLTISFRVFREIIFVIKSASWFFHSKVCNWKSSLRYSEVCRLFSSSFTLQHNTISTWRFRWNCVSFYMSDRATGNDWGFLWRNQSIYAFPSPQIFFFYPYLFITKTHGHPEMNVGCFSLHSCVMFNGRPNVFVWARSFRFFELNSVNGLD